MDSKSCGSNIFTSNKHEFPFSTIAKSLVEFLNASFERGVAYFIKLQCTLGRTQNYFLAKDNAKAVLTLILYIEN